jgi:hypothetical protein
VSVARGRAQVAQRQRQFHGFLAREQAHEERRQRRLEERTRAASPCFQPAINAKSKSLHSQTNHGNFLERVEKDKMRKERADVRRTAAAADTEDCTFKPTINSTSSRRRARSAVRVRACRPAAVKSRRRIRRRHEVPHTRAPCLSPRAFCPLVRSLSYTTTPDAASSAAGCDATRRLDVFR